MQVPVRSGSRSGGLLRMISLREMLDLSCACPSRGLEVRLFVDGEFSASIASVEINGESAEPMSEFKTQGEIKNTLACFGRTWPKASIRR
jgi:hypothetical protein